MKLKHMKAFLGTAGMAVLILDGQTALRGAANGMELCLKTVIPSLFPFLFFCSLLTGALWGSRSRWLVPLSSRLGIPQGAESLLMAAVLGGYPAGAGAIGDAYRENRLSRQDAAHLLTFCSNAGPAFLFGMTALQFSSGNLVWGLWAIQILSALLTGLLASRPSHQAASLPDRSQSVSQTLTNSVRTMAAVCGWILLFQVLLAFLDRWLFGLLPETVQVVLTGLLELSSGCCRLAVIDEEPVRFLVCTGMLSFGGACVAMQTASVTGGLPLSAYVRGKLIQTAIALVLALLWQAVGWGILWTALLFFPMRMKKRSGFLRRASV